MYEHYGGKQRHLCNDLLGITITVGGAGLGI